MDRFANSFRLGILTLILFISMLLLSGAAGGDSAIFGEPVFTLATASLSTLRLIPIAAALLLATLIYMWAKEIIGRWWAMFPVVLFAFSPIVLAHGHYVTRDIFSALGIFLSIFLFTKFLDRPTRILMLSSGTALGATLFISSAALFVVAYLLALSFIYFLVNRVRPFWRHIAAIFTICSVVLWIAVFLTTIHIPVETAIEQANGSEIITSLFKTPLTKPIAHYITSSLRTPEAVPTLGASFMLLYFLKESLGIVLVMLCALLLCIWHAITGLRSLISKKMYAVTEYFSTHFSEFSMMLFVGVYLFAGIKGGVTEVKYILPALPYIYIIASRAIKRWFSSSFQLRRGILYFILHAKAFIFKTSLIAASVFLIIVSAIITYPHFLSFHNLAAGGAFWGYKYSVGSNYDDGQDLKRLAEWAYITLDTNETIAVDYFGGDNVSAHISKSEEWWSARGNPAFEGITWLAISITKLKTAKNNPSLPPEEQYLWLEDYEKPFTRAGKTIFIYSLYKPDSQQ